MASYETAQGHQLARDLQRSLLPATLPYLEGFDLAVYSQPAERVGGDCYDVQLDGRLDLLIADATGHGLPAAVHMARAQAYLRAEIAAGKLPEEVLAAANRQLAPERRTPLGVTALHAQVDLESRLLRYARAGHPPPILVRGSQAHFLEAGGSPLGVLSQLELEGASVRLEEGDVLVLYTDGIIEAQDEHRSLYTEEGLVEQLLAHQQEPAQRILDLLVDAVNQFIQPAAQQDDITLIVLKVDRASQERQTRRIAALSGGTRRPIALGFVRLAGASTMPPVAALMDQVLSAREALWEPLSEEGFLLVLGAPRVHEDDAARALEAMQELRARLRAFPAARLSAGLHAGQVIAKPDGGIEYSLIGQTLNRAFALEQQAGAGRILLSDHLHRLAGAYLDLSAATTEVGGSPPAYALQDVALQPIEHWQRGAWAQATPYVGRDRELAQLRAYLAECEQGRTGRPRLIGIRGEAGMGKSRLLREFAGQVQRQQPQCLLLRGRARAYGNQPYALFSSLVQDYLKLETRGGDCRAVLESCLGELASHLPPAEQAGLQAARSALGYLLGVEYPDSRLPHLDAQNLQQEIQIGLRTFLGALIHQAGTCPVLQLEDLHWADTSSLRLLSSLLESQEAPAPLLVLTTYREYYTGSSGSEEIVLAPLDQPACEALARAILPEQALSEAALQLCAERAAGNPLFLEELAWSLSTQDIRSGSQEIPDTLTSLLLAQMDRLDATARRVAQLAAVIGQEFDGALLAKLAGRAELSPALLQAGLETLSGAGVVFLHPEGGHFKHALTRDAAYGTLLPGDLQTLHGLVAETIEALFAEQAPFYSLLAHHWHQAQVRPKALEYQEKAGAQALSNGAYQEALGFFSEVLALDTQPDPGTDRSAIRLRRAHWERQLAEAHLGLGNPAEGRRHLQQALVLLGWPEPARRAGLIKSIGAQVLLQVLHRLWPAFFVGRFQSQSAPFLEAARAYMRLVETYWFANETVPLVHSGIRALNLAEGAGPSPELARAYAIMCLSTGSIPQHQLAEMYRRRSLEIARAIEQPQALAYALFIPSVYGIGAGKWAQVREALGQAVELFEQVHDRRLLGDSLTVLGMSALYQGEFRDSERQFAQVLAAGQRHNNTQHQVWGLIGKAEGVFRLGRVDEALDLLQEALALLAQNPDRAEELRAQGLLAVVQLRRGEPELAHQAAEQAAQLIAQLSAPTAHYLLEGYVGVAEVYLARWEAGSWRSPVALSALARQARRACAELRKYARIFLIGQPRAYLCQGRAHWLAGHPARARRAWHQSLEAGQRLGMPYEQGLAHYALGQYAEEGDPAGQEHLSRAGELFARLETPVEYLKALAVSKRGEEQ